MIKFLLLLYYIVTVTVVLAASGKSSKGKSSSGKYKSRSAKKRKGRTKKWKIKKNEGEDEGEDDGDDASLVEEYEVALIQNDYSKKGDDIFKLWQFESMPNQATTIANSSICRPLDNVGGCVYPDFKKAEIRKDNTLSQIKLVFDTTEYFNAVVYGFQVSLDIFCDNGANVNWAWLAVSNDFTLSKNYTMILTGTGKCHPKKHGIVDSVGVSLQYNYDRYDCGIPKSICDPTGMLAGQKCERVNTFAPLYINITRDCGVPADMLFPNVGYV